MGATVVFLVPAELDEGDYPAGTSFDPQTNMPFDPTVEPTAPAPPTEVEVVASVVHRPIDTDVRDNTVNEAIGLINSANTALIISIEDRARVEGATAVRIWDEEYVITEFRPDGLNVVDRFIVYTESK